MKINTNDNNKTELRVIEFGNSMSKIELGVWIKGRSIIVLSHVSYGLDVFTKYITNKETGISALITVAEAVQRFYDTIELSGCDFSRAQTALGTFIEFGESISLIVDLLNLFELEVDQQGNVTGIKIHQEVNRIIEERDWVEIGKRVELIAMHALSAIILIGNRLSSSLDPATAQLIARSIVIIYISYQILGIIESIQQIRNGENVELAYAKLIRHTVEVGFQIAMMSTGATLALCAVGVFTQTLDVICDATEGELSQRKIVQLQKSVPNEEFIGLATMSA